MKIRVLYFAQAREAAGTGEDVLDFSGETLESLLNSIIEKNPGIKKVLGSCSFAVNMRIVRNKNVRLKEGDTVAVLPPVAGG